MSLIFDNKNERLRIFDKRKNLKSETESDEITIVNSTKHIKTESESLVLSSPRKQNRTSANKIGTKENVQINELIEIVSHTVENSYIIYGFDGACTGDTFYELYLNGLLEASFLTNVINKNATYRYASAKFLPKGTVITLKGRNLGTGTTRIDGIIQGEEIRNV